MSRVLLAIAVSGFVFANPLAQTLNVAELLPKVAAERQRYLAAFKDLTANETKTTEIFDGQGKVSQRRVIVSEFLVVESRIKPGIAFEYRLTRSIDGQPIRENVRQVGELFERLAKARTLQQEASEFRDENLKHTLGFYRWGFTVAPLPQLGAPGVTFTVAGRERVGDRDAIVLTYQRDALRPNEFRGLTRSFTDARTGNRGRVWLDPETAAMWRWENESTVVDRDIRNETVLSHDDMEYVSSPFGFYVPGRVVTSFYEKSGSQARASLRLASRITHSYDQFRRFEVETGYRLKTN